MCTILLVGADTALLEGLAQTLGSAGHRAVLAPGMREALEAAVQERPLLAVVDRALVPDDGGALLRLPLAPGGARVLYRAVGVERDSISAALQRATIADLALPLERHRLAALVRHVEERAASTGRGRTSTPSEVPRVR